MKIAIVCPIGDLSRFGYQRVARACLKGWLAVGDLFLIHSSRAEMPFKIKATYIRDDRTLLKMVDGVERFDYRVVANNANIGLQAARLAGYDAAITICVNWYVEAIAARAIIAKCEVLPNICRDYDFLFRRMQIRDQLFDSDLASIAIFRISGFSTFSVGVLADKVEVNGNNVLRERGEFCREHSAAYIDVGLEVTDAEFADKMQDVRNYEDLLPKRRGVGFDYWVDYFQQRKANMRPSVDGLGVIGKQILALHQAGSFGDRLL
jgi:hypothetical protein